MAVNIPGTSASLGYGAPQYIAADSLGNLFLVDQSIVLRLDATTGLLTVVAGNGTESFSGDNGPATSAELYGPFGVAADSAGAVYVADSNNNRIRVLTLLGSSCTYSVSPTTSQAPASGGNLTVSIQTTAFCS